MGNRYPANHIAKDHLHTDITCNAGEPQQKYRLGMVSNRLLGGLNAFSGSKLYACESRNFTANLEKRRHAFEMRCYPRILNIF